MSRDKEIAPRYVESLWKLLASVKLTVIVLSTVAATAIIGTIVAQNASSADYLRFYGPFLYQLFVALDIIDMYHSWWFQLLILLLVLNIIVCSIERLRLTWKTIFTRKPKFKLEHLRQQKSRLEFEITSTSDSIQDRYLQRVARSFRYQQVFPADQGFTIVAEKGRWTRLGVYIVHLSVVVLLVGALIGTLFGFEGYVNIPEGETRDSIRLRNSAQPYQLPFAIRCDDFDVQFYASKTPKEFRSRLSILENGQPVMQRDIIVNDPLSYKGINIYQSNWDEQRTPPPANIPADLTKPVKLSFRSTVSGMIYVRETIKDQAIKLPEGLGHFVLHTFEPNAQFKGVDLGPAWVGKLTPLNGSPQTVVLPLQHPKFDTMRQGKVIIAPDDTMPRSEPAEPRYITGLQVVYDPGVDMVYTGFIMMILGCVITFFMSHQQVMVAVTLRDQGSTIVVAGKANTNKFGFQQKIKRLADDLTSLGRS